MRAAIDELIHEAFNALQHDSSPDEEAHRHLEKVLRNQFSATLKKYQVDRIAELERQNAELRKDAERYRQLRNKSALQFEHPIVVSQHHEVGEGMRYMGPVIDRELDRLVDYAIAADQKGKAS